MLDTQAQQGVWKSGKGRGRKTPKGRQYEDNALDEVRSLLTGRTRDRDLLIEFLHLIQDKYGHLSAAHLRALAEEMRLSMAEVYEVATFYHHFNVTRDAHSKAANLTVRVCDGISCEMRGAHNLLEDLTKKYNTEDLSSITDANKVQQTADEAIKDCEEGIKRLDKLGIDNPPIKGQLEKSITTLETLKSEVDEGFMPKDEVAAKKLVKAVSQNEKICKFFNDTLKNNVGQMGTQYITDAK